jgi:uridine kinase
MKPFVVGIAGGSGSGKTTLIRLLQAELGSDIVTVVSQDDYYLPIQLQEKDQNGEVNFDLPDSIDSTKLLQDVSSLMKGEDLIISRYTFNNANDASSDIKLESRPVIVVEGLFILHYSAVQELFDVTLFVDAHPHTRFERRLKRDTSERGYKEHIIKYQWENHVEPAFRSYLLPHRDTVDIIIDNEYDMKSGINDLIDVIHKEVTPRLTS